MAKKKQPSKVVRVVYVDDDGIPYSDRRQKKQLTRQEVDRLQAKGVVIIERVN